MQWYIDVLKNYSNFEGRARRKEYWMFALINFIISCVILVFALKSFAFIVLYGVYGLFVFVPSLALTIRRLHDIGKSGWMFLVSFIPFVGGIILLILTLMDSEPRDNQYGPNPKGIGQYNQQSAGMR